MREVGTFGATGLANARVDTRRNARGLMLDVSTRTLQMLAIATMVPAALACGAATAGLEPVIVDIAVGGAVGLSVPSGEGATSLVLVEERAPWTAPPTPPGGPYFETRMSVSTPPTTP